MSGPRGVMAAAGASLVLLAVAPVAMAHVSVLPGTAVQGTSTEFTIRVPAEEGRTTTGVRVAFPKQVTVYAVADAPGWATRLITRPDGTLSGAAWTGGSIPPGRYADFTVLGTPFDLGQSVWPAWQSTANGQVKRWTGPPEAPGAETTETGAGRPGPASAEQVVASAAEAAPAGESGGGGTSLWLGVIAIAISLAALAGVGLVWSSRPRDLPPDGPDDR